MTIFKFCKLENIGIKLIYHVRHGTATDLVKLYTSKITKATAEIKIGMVITKFSEFLSVMMNMYSSKTGVDGHVRDNDQMLEVTNKVLTSAWSDIIRGMVQYRIRESVMLDIHRKTRELFESTKKLFVREIHHRENTNHFKPLPVLSNRLREYNNQIKMSRGPQMRTKIDARVISKHGKCNIIILDVDKEPILTISSHDIQKSIKLIYNPPCPLYPGGYFDAYVKGKVKVARYPTEDIEDCDMLYTAINVCVGDEHDFKYHISRGTVKTYIDEHPSDAGRLLSIDAYTYQLKRGTCLTTARHELSNETNEPMCI